ncbi:MAG TPA: hypothetical protein VFI98_15175 [Pseudolabrys sp.]|jgi:hypothetical protein|nr:hypothetical protein [Pseudolabrys sp.]
MVKRTRVRARRPRTTACKISEPPADKRISSHRYVFTPELLAYARHRFEHTDASLADIAVDLGIHKGTAGDLAKREGWVRYVPPPRDLAPSVRLLEAAEALSLQPALTGSPPAHATDGVTPEGQANDEGALPPLAETVVRLHRAVLDELAALESMRARIRRQPQSGGEAERTARTISRLTETLQKLQRLQCNAPENGSDYDIPADIDEFRNELARRIDEFVSSRAHTGDGE